MEKFCRCINYLKTLFITLEARRIFYPIIAPNDTFTICLNRYMRNQLTAYTNIFRLILPFKWFSWLKSLSLMLTSDPSALTIATSPLKSDTCQTYVIRFLRTSLLLKTMKCVMGSVTNSHSQKLDRNQSARNVYDCVYYVSIPPSTVVRLWILK